jgi:hypothetical protein
MIATVLSPLTTSQKTLLRNSLSTGLRSLYVWFRCQQTDRKESRWTRWEGGRTDSKFARSYTSKDHIRPMASAPEIR